MYEIEEFYAEDGSNLKEILKSCIFNYYINNNVKSIPSIDLKNHHLLNTNNKRIQVKEENNVYTV